MRKQKKLNADDHRMVAANMAKLPEMVALYQDVMGSPRAPWERPAIAQAILVRAGTIGYWPAPAHIDVDEFNKGATRQQIMAMLGGSMFGFHCPIADADSYREDGSHK
jgi:hypothetical protein